MHILSLLIVTGEYGQVAITIKSYKLAKPRLDFWRGFKIHLTQRIVVMGNITSWCKISNPCVSMHGRVEKIILLVSLVCSDIPDETKYFLVDIMGRWNLYSFLDVLIFDPLLVAPGTTGTSGKWSTLRLFNP